MPTKRALIHTEKSWKKQQRTQAHGTFEKNTPPAKALNRLNRSESRFPTSTPGRQEVSVKWQLKRSTDLRIFPLLRGTFLSQHRGGSVSARAAPLSSGQHPFSRPLRLQFTEAEGLGQGNKGALLAFLIRNSHQHRGVFTSAHRLRLDGRKAAGGGEFSDRAPPHRPGRRSVPRQQSESSPSCPSPARPGHGADERSRHYTQARPARPPHDEPRLTPPGAGEKHKQWAMSKRSPSGRRHAAFRAIFTFVGLGDLRHFVQRQRRRGGTGAAPPLPPHGAARASSAQARPPSRGMGGRPRLPPDGRRAEPMGARGAAGARAGPSPP